MRQSSLRARASAFGEAAHSAFPFTSPSSLPFESLISSVDATTDRLFPFAFTDEKSTQQQDARKTSEDHQACHQVEGKGRVTESPHHHKKGAERAVNDGDRPSAGPPLVRRSPTQASKSSHPNNDQEHPSRTLEIVHNLHNRPSIPFDNYTDVVTRTSLPNQAGKIEEGTSRTLFLAVSSPAKP